MKEKGENRGANKIKNPRPYKDFVFAYYVWIALAAIILWIGVKIVPHSPIDWPLWITILGGIISFVFLVQKHRLEDLRLFKELFVEFNHRYSLLNEEMNSIVRQENHNEALSEKQKDSLFEYFNLCGEEYLFYKEGYILREVWEVWIDGMAFFYEADPRIRDLWGKELALNPYYGFKLEFLEEKADALGL